MKLNRIFMLNERRILNNEVIFKTNSPILIEDLEENPVLPIESGIEYFNKQFNAIHHRILKDIRGDRLKMLYQIGIGSRTGQGFGMVEVV
jgi:CRISPR-associated endoribonuclease Cas6